MTACTNSREAVNCIVTERCRWQEERGQDGAAVDRKTTLQGSFSSGTAIDSIAKNVDMGLLQILESIGSKSRIFLIAERFLKRYNNLVTLSRRTVT